MSMLVHRRIDSNAAVREIRELRKDKERLEFYLGVPTSLHQDHLVVRANPSDPTGSYRLSQTRLDYLMVRDHLKAWPTSFFTPEELNSRLRVPLPFVSAALDLLVAEGLVFHDLGSFAWSFPAADRVLAFLRSRPESVFSAGAVSDLLGLRLGRARAALNGLVDQGLVLRSADGFFSLPRSGRRFSPAGPNSSPGAELKSKQEG